MAKTFHLFDFDGTLTGVSGEKLIFQTDFYPSLLELENYSWKEY